jgi:hypothetical protein
VNITVNTVNVNLSFISLSLSRVYEGGSSTNSSENQKAIKTHMTTQTLDPRQSSVARLSLFFYPIFHLLIQMQEIK